MTLTQFKVNLPPSNGSCYSATKAGRALVDRFKIVCAGWTAIRLPLSYKIEILKKQSSNEKDDSAASQNSSKDAIDQKEDAIDQKEDASQYGNSRLLYYGSNDTVSLVLPVGDKASGYLLPLKVGIVDFYGSVTEVILNVTVSIVIGTKSLFGMVGGILLTSTIFVFFVKIKQI